MVYDSPPAQIVPLPRPNPLREMLNDPLFKMFAAYGRQDPQSLPTQLGLPDIPEGELTDRSIGYYNPHDQPPNPYHQPLPTMTPNVANWDQWLAGLPESSNVQDLRTPQEKIWDYDSWARSYRTTPAIEMPLPSSAPPRYYRPPTDVQPFPPTPFGGPPK